MARSTRFIVLLGTVATSIALLSACGKKAPDAPNTPPPAASTTATAAATPATSTTTTATHAPAAPATPPASASSAVAGNGSIAAPASSASVAEPQAPTSLSVTKLTVGSKVNSMHEVAHASDHFSADDKIIYATVSTAGSGSNAKLNAKWSYLEGKGQVISNISQAVTTNGPAFTTFKVENPDMWPQGKYRVEIALDSKTVSTQDFRIGKR